LQFPIRKIEHIIAHRAFRCFQTLTQLSGVPFQGVKTQLKKRCFFVLQLLRKKSVKRQVADNE
jgi:hypothetical protein